MVIKPDEVIAYDIYFSGIVAMSVCHPGAGREGYAKPSMVSCSNLAKEMLAQRRIEIEQMEAEYFQEQADEASRG